MVVEEVAVEFDAAVKNDRFNNFFAPTIIHQGYRRKKARWYLRLLKTVLEAGIVFLLSRFALPGPIYPAGIGYCLISRNQKFMARILLWCGLFAGSIMTRSFEESVAITAAVALFVFVQALIGRRRKKSAQVAAFTVWVLLRFAAAFLLDPRLKDLPEVISEIIIGFILARIFQNGLNFIGNPFKKSKTAVIALALIILGAVGGTNQLMIESIPITDLSVSLVLILIAYLGGGGVGAAMGVSLGIVVGIAAGGMITLIALYSVVGFMGGIFKNLGKWGAIIGFCLGYYFITQHLQAEFESIEQLLPWSLGLGAFIMTPKRYLTQISNYFPNETKPADPEVDNKGVRELILNRLNDLALIFTELAKSFHEEPDQQLTAPKIDLYTMLDQVCAKNCRQCNGYQTCWGENFYSTYRELFDLLALAELYGEVNAKNLKGRLASNCFQQFKLLTTVNHLFEKCQADYYWRRKLEESKSFLANQLQGMAQIINKLAVEVTADPEFRAEIENQLVTCLNRVGINIKDTAVLGLGDRGVEIRIKQRSCNRKRECQYLMTPLISRLLGEDYNVWERNCQLENGDCSYCLTPVSRFEIRTVVCKLPKDGNEASGDNHALHELKDGHFIAILSDGMGNGSKAAVQSNTTVSILEKLLETGVDRDFAVKMVNSILLLRTPEESFATVDLSIINLHTGRSEFIKIGAATTYIKRGRDVWSIKSTSLPAGILNSVDLERTVVQLHPGDLIIMVTDGVIDSKIEQVGQEDWMVRALRQVEVVGPEALGEYLMNLARVNQDGVLKDDMTVIVLQFIEKGMF
ncbi:MAG: stage II sporulation protein E [Firmicutes bacterium]|nr:stage II sporulation protein E [Bacillota bacterium]